MKKSKFLKKFLKKISKENFSEIFSEIFEELEKEDSLIEKIENLEESLKEEKLKNEQLDYLLTEASKKVATAVCIEKNNKNLLDKIKVRENDLISSFKLQISEREKEIQSLKVQVSDRDNKINGLKKECSYLNFKDYQNTHLLLLYHENKKPNFKVNLKIEVFSKTETFEIFTNFDDFGKRIEPFLLEQYPFLNKYTFEIV